MLNKEKKNGYHRIINQKTGRLKLVKHYQGNWKEVPGIFFQDIVILEKSGKI